MKKLKNGPFFKSSGPWPWSNCRAIDDVNYKLISQKIEKIEKIFEIFWKFRYSLVKFNDPEAINEKLTGLIMP